MSFPRCLELHRCAADLSRTLGIQLGDYVSSGKEQEASPGIGFLQLTDMAFSDVWVEVHRSGIPSAQHVKHMESMVFGCCFKELPGHSTYTQQYCALLCFYRGEFVTAGRWARSAYLAWTEGRSDVRNCLGASAGMLSVGLWHICDVMAGNTAGEAAFSLAQEIGAAGGSARALGFACATMAAALWESLDSSRVDALFGTAMAAKEAKGNAGPEDVLASCWLVGLGKLRAAGPAAAGNLTTWLEKVMALVDRAQNGGPLACLLPVAARRIVQEVAGMGSIGMPADGNVASKYRQHCKEGLKRCVETWERLLTAPEGQIFMGGSLSYCKAWLYWLECLDSPGKDPSQGLQGVIDALLEACRTSTSAVARESLAGTLPATIALCRILSNSRNERKPRKAPERLFKTLMRRSTWSMRTWKVTVPSHVFENPGTGTTWEVVLAKSSSMRVSLGSAVARSWARSALLAVVGQLECRPCSAKDAGSADWGMLAQHGSENSLLREARKLLDDIACAADRRNLAQ